MSRKKASPSVVMANIIGRMREESVFVDIAASFYSQVAK